jgi:hypothetical protein
MDNSHDPDMRFNAATGSWEQYDYDTGEFVAVDESVPYNFPTQGTASTED